MISFPPLVGEISRFSVPFYVRHEIAHAGQQHVCKRKVCRWSKIRKRRTPTAKNRNEKWWMKRATNKSKKAVGRRKVQVDKRRAAADHKVRSKKQAHHSIGAVLLALSMCHSSKAARSQSCHFALFVNPVARSSITMGNV